MYEIHYTRLGFKSEEDFETIDAALDYGKAKNVEFDVLDAHGVVVAYYTKADGVHRR